MTYSGHKAVDRHGFEDCEIRMIEKGLVRWSESCEEFDFICEHFKIIEIFQYREAGYGIGFDLKFSHSRNFRLWFHNFNTYSELRIEFTSRGILPPEERYMDFLYEYLLDEVKESYVDFRLIPSVTKI